MNYEGMTDEQKKEASERIQKVRQFMVDNDVEVLPYPQLELTGISPHDGSPIYGIKDVAKLVDVRYAPKPDVEGEDKIPSPFN